MGWSSHIIEMSAIYDFHSTLLTKKYSPLFYLVPEPTPFSRSRLRDLGRLEPEPPKDVVTQQY